MSNLFSETSVAIIFIVCFFILVTKKQLRKLVSESSLYINANWLKVRRNGEQNIIPKDDQQKIKQLINDSKSQDYKEFELKLNNYINEAEEIKNQKKYLEEEKNQIFAQWIKYMFAYLNLFLVPNSKSALLWIYNNPNLSKEKFIENFTPPAPVENISEQKEIMFSVLISENLIQSSEQGLYRITNIGKDFLKYIGSISYDSI